MSADVIDINGPLEERRFKARENRLKDMKAAFRAARLGAQAAAKSSQPGKSSGKRRKKNQPPEK